MSESWTQCPVSALCHSHSNGACRTTDATVANAVEQKWRVMCFGFQPGQKHGFSLSFELKLMGVNRSRSSVLRVHFLFACHRSEVTQPARRHNGCWSELQTEATLAVDWEASKLSDYYQKWDKQSTTPTNTHVAPKAINASTNNIVLQYEQSSDKV